MSTDPKPAPATMRELCAEIDRQKILPESAKMTWTEKLDSPQRDLMRRCSSGVMLKVMASLESARGLATMVEPGEEDDLKTVSQIEQLVGQLTEAIALLNATSERAGGAE